MNLRNRHTGEVITERKFRDLFNHEGASDWARISLEYINSKDYDIVYEGPQASGGTVYQHSQLDGVELINGKWYTKYVLGPMFKDVVKDDGTLYTASQQEQDYQLKKDLEQISNIKQQQSEILNYIEKKELESGSLSLEWQDYKSSIVDIDKQPGYPWSVNWPDRP